MPDIFGRVARCLRNGAAPALGLAVASLSACGGGGGDNSSPAPPVNQAPVFTSAASVTAVENISGSIYQATASDGNGDTVTYTITSGPDAQRFTLSSSGQLSFVASPNFDLAADADANNVYELQIGANDGKTTTTLSLTITVTNSKEGIDVRRVATGFINPTAISPISPTAVLVAEKAGSIFVLNPETGAKTLGFQITNVGTIGVTAITASPTFARDGGFFVMYTTASGFLIVTRFYFNPNTPTGPGNFDRVFGASAPQYAGGGWLGYDASGVLFAATGDAGGQGDPTGSAQSDTSLLGKLLRIDPNPDPFAGASPLYFLVSPIAKGFHQPNGGSQFGNGILLADHGQDIAEEINLLTNLSGGNFGWPFKEGSRTVAGNAPGGLIDPVLEYYRSSGLRTGQSIIGGAAGPSAVASLRNQYIFADGNGAIFAIGTGLISAGATRSSEVLERRDADFVPDAGAITRPVAITAGPGGTLFILDADGEVFRVDGS